MRSHQITEKDISDFKPKVRIAGSHGKGSNKTLDMYINPLYKRIWFVITDHKVEIAKVPELIEAIDIYNRLK